MAQYTVQRNQNIFDVAILLYGSIEGIFDLLISNRWLTMTTDLKMGMKLEYHDYFTINEGVVTEIGNQGVRPANLERHVYLKQPALPQVIQIAIAPDNELIQFEISGEGDAFIDWGDNSELQRIALTHTDVHVEHYFDNKVEKRIVKIYGNFSILHWDVSLIDGNIYALRPITVDEFTSCRNDNPLDALALFEGTYKLTLKQDYIADLTPIYAMSLQELDLRGSLFRSVDVIDDYLTNIVENYNNRRSGTVYLTQEPSDTGMDAIYTIIGEPEWNYPVKWVFNINGRIYTAD